MSLLPGVRIHTIAENLLPLVLADNVKASPWEKARFDVSPDLEWAWRRAAEEIKIMGYILFRVDASLPPRTYWVSDGETMNIYYVPYSPNIQRQQGLGTWGGGE